MGSVAALLGFLTLSAVAIGLARRETRATDATLAEAARLCSGTVKPGGWTSRSRLQWVVDGIPAELRYNPGDGDSEPETRVRFHWRPPGNLRIAPEGTFSFLRKAFGAQDIELSDPAFDARYMIQGTPEAWVRQVLDPLGRQIVDDLGGYGGVWYAGRVRIEAGPSGVTIRVPVNLVETSYTLQGFQNSAVAFLARLRHPSPPGVQVLESVAVAGGRCPVCNDDLSGAAVRCRSCGTLHHLDCWDYFGGCAIFGCFSCVGVRTNLWR